MKDTHTLDDAITLARKYQHLVGQPIVLGIDAIIWHVLVAPAVIGTDTFFETVYRNWNDDHRELCKYYPDTAYDVMILGCYSNILLKQSLEGYMRGNGTALD